MTLRKSSKDIIQNLEREIKQVTKKLDKARTKKLLDAERISTSANKKLLSAKTKLRKLRDKKSAAVAASKTKKTKSSIERIEKAKLALSEQYDIVNSLSVDASIAREKFKTLKSESKHRATIEKESFRAMSALKSKIRKESNSKKASTEVEGGKPRIASQRKRKARADSKPKSTFNEKPEKIYAATGKKEFGSFQETHTLVTDDKAEQQGVADIINSEINKGITPKETEVTVGSVAKEDGVATRLIKEDPSQKRAESGAIKLEIADTSVDLEINVQDDRVKSEKPTKEAIGEKTHSLFGNN